MAKPPSKNASFGLILPVLNSPCSIPTKVPIPLSDTVSFRTIRPLDLVTLTSDDGVPLGMLKGTTFTLTIDGFDPTKNWNGYLNQILCALFSMNILGQETAIAVDRAFVIRSLQKRTLDGVRDLPALHQGQRVKFEIEKGADFSVAKDLFRSSLLALQAHKPLSLTLSRFNSALGRASQEDRLVDLCIALESVFQAQAEATFKFSLYNSLLSEAEPAKRLQIFNLLKELYKARSKLVHGSGEVDQVWVDANWSALIRIAKTAILRKIEFLSSHNHDQWKEYLENLALGIDHGIEEAA